MWRVECVASGEDALDPFSQFVPDRLSRDFHADALRPATRGMRRIDPGDRSPQRDLRGLLHERQQQEDLLAEGVSLRARHEESAAGQEGHP